MKKQILLPLLAIAVASGLFGVSLLSPTKSQVFGGALTNDTLNNLVTDFTSIATVLGGAAGAPSGSGGVCLTTGCAMATPGLANPVITGPAPTACGATCSATAGQLVLLNIAAGSVVTIPTSSGSGNVIRMRITVATTSAAEKVLLTTTADAIIGTAIGENAGTAKIFVGNASTYHSLQMPFTGTQPSGGFIGDAIVCTDIAAGTWACDVVYQAGVTPTTPYSASTT